MDEPTCIHLTSFQLEDGKVAWDFHIWGADDNNPIVVGTRDTLAEAIEATLQYVRGLTSP